MENKNERNPHFPQRDHRTDHNRIPEDYITGEENGALIEDPVSNINGVNDPAVVPEVPEEVIREKNDRPAANTIKWAIIIAIILMIIIYFIVFHDQDGVLSAP